MQKIAKTCFPRAMQVIDRFHVQKLVHEAVQELRITYRWQVIKEENKAMKAAKEKGKYKSRRTRKRRYTPGNYWPEADIYYLNHLINGPRSQKIRGRITFQDSLEDIKHVYYYSLELGKIFSTNYDKDVARAKLALWYNKIEEYGYDTFTTVANSIENHYERILNFCVNRSTNAAAEAFNAKIKAFRASFRGVVDMSFFLFRLAKVYA
ncbi:MAG: ISL3 family transposase [Bacteroides xylanisolvens]